MGSDNNCNNYYNIEQTSAASTPYYQTLSSQSSSSQSSMVKNINNEWMNTEQSSDANSANQNQDSEPESQRDHIMRGNEIPSSRSHKSYNQISSSQQHLQMTPPQWSFPVGNSYQRFYGDSHYGIVITPNVSQQGSLVSTPSSSIHSLNSEIQTQSHHHVHQIQTNHHLKKIYYQGLDSFLFWYSSLRLNIVVISSENRMSLNTLKYRN